MPKRLTTEKFKLKANSIHGDKYDYSKFVYVNNRTKGIIICKEHGEFEQIPDSHLNGKGCPTCGGTKKSSTKKFKLKANEVHGNKYDYSKVVYVNSKTKVIIGCPIHGDFKQTPNNHLRSQGCPSCSGSKKSSTENFKLKAKLIHGDRYDYSKFVYVNNRTKGIIICKEHGEFEQIPASHLNGSGCPKCGGKQQKTTEDFKLKANSIHGDKYDYSKVVYVTAHKKVIIGCKEHGDFEQIANDHLNGIGCPECGIITKSLNKTLSTKEIIPKFKLVHGDRYDYSKVEYIGAHEKVIIGCKEHGDFEQIPNKHLSGQGCLSCSKQGYSKKAIIWLNQIAKEQNIYIQHAENEGEYRIPGTNYKADGYCQKTNTIYEFYGDIWHGNLNLFEENDLCHPFNNETAGSLYKKTKQREQQIINLGYNLITIWEEDY